MTNISGPFLFLILLPQSSSYHTVLNSMFLHVLPSNPPPLPSLPSPPFPSQVDERAVLKHFDWPEAKADALREASFEYQDLARLQADLLAQAEAQAQRADGTGAPLELTLKRSFQALERWGSPTEGARGGVGARRGSWCVRGFDPANHVALYSVACDVTDALIMGSSSMQGGAEHICAATNA